MITYWDGHYYMEWYNGVKSESVQNRVLYSTSTDAVHWSPPAVMFNTTGRIGLENEASVNIQGRRYSVAGSWDVFDRKGGGAEHTGPDTPMMRRVYGPNKLGPVFWLGKEVPQGYEHFDYPVYTDKQRLGEQTVADASSYLAALVDAEPTSDWGRPNERVMYQLPANRRRLMMLLRSGGALKGEPAVGPHMLFSTCELAVTAPAAAENNTYHACRPITGLYNVGLPGDAMPQGSPATEPVHVAGAPSPWPGYHPVPVGHHCNWSAPVVTTIPDSHSRACTAPLPDGRIFMIGAQIPRGRDPIVLSLSKDGLDWDQAFAVRHCDVASCKPRFGGPPGFQYPAAMWKLDGPRGPEIIFSYSVRKHFSRHHVCEALRRAVARR